MSNFSDMENDDDMIIVYGTPTNWYQIKEAISRVKPDIEFEIDEVSYDLIHIVVFVLSEPSAENDIRFFICKSLVVDCRAVHSFHH